jgi:hypothetical protein
MPLPSLDDVVEAIDAVYPIGEAPREFKLARAAFAMRRGRSPDEVARDTGLHRPTLKAVGAAADPIQTIFKTTLQPAEEAKSLKKARQGIGQMLIGGLAERAFEQIYKTTIGTDELRLEDSRASRNDTDYFVFNGSGRKVFRLNIKFHGTRFRKAADLVGLDPADCFALATYKIKQGLEKSKEERTPYVFAIVGVPDLTGEKVGLAMPERLINLLALVFSSKMGGKRTVEDDIVRHLIDRPPPDVKHTVEAYAQQIAAAEWRMLSAKRAYDLMREKLFERVYALSVNRFTRNYPGAEVDMHFAVSTELTPLTDFLKYYKEHGLHGLAVRLTNGEV